MLNVPEDLPTPVDVTTDAGTVVSTRLVSLDAFRGFIMIAMASAGLGLSAVADATDGFVWKLLASQTEHADWQGGSFWDLIQPSFMFIVGVAMPWAYANRRAKGQGWWTQFGHALVRSLALVVLGVFLMSNGSKQTSWSFVNVLTQIGLGYPFVFLILGWKPRWQFAAAVAVLIGYWAFFAFWPLPDSAGRWPVVSTWDTMINHWTQRTNAAESVDLWLLNRLPYPDGKPFLGNSGGYATLNFVPSIATAIFGVLVGRLLKDGRPPRTTLQILMIVGALGIVLGTLMGGTICPVVKRIWTPSWVVASTGWTCLIMAGFYLVVDVWGWRRLVFPLLVVGTNSIAMYVMSMLLKPWIRQTLRTHLTTLIYVTDHGLGLGSVVPRLTRDRGIFAGVYGPMFDAIAVLMILWLVCLWLYRRKIFIRL